ncbi:OmpA family protein [Spirosoma taeanense]|uniref:OmpA family protein n=1 Tax=Spirosoma taeanense TaxID=2735870 RepID=A0A6M5YBA8_9BACT|nr:PA14 domain-containing protein [Spirosoma taeanense]QJW90533.1 OmpA family protein [Spirosoma taeanense]
MEASLYSLIVGLSLLFVTGHTLAQKPVSGLKGEYFNGPNFEKKVCTRTDPQINFRWDWASEPAPGVQREYFSVRWTGKLYAPTSGVYHFSALVDDGVRVWVGNQKVLDEWRKQDDSNFIGSIRLRGKQWYDLKVEYYNDWKGSVIQLFWAQPNDQRIGLISQSIYRTIIPGDYLALPTPSRKPVAVRPAQVAAAPPRKAANQPIDRSTPVVNAPAKKSLAAFARVSTVKADHEPAEAASEPVAAKPFVMPERGKTLVLQQVRFEQSSYVLLSESFPFLNQLAKALKENPALRIEISGHTDNVGDPRLNQTLSEYRAKQVASYLIRQGVAEGRLEARGYGSTRPLFDNSIAAEQARNRRVEIKLL